MTSTIYTKELKSYVLVVLCGAIGGLVTIGLVMLFDSVINLIWQRSIHINTNDPSRTILGPILILIAGLIIGIITKRFGNVTGALDKIIIQVSRSGRTEWRDLPKTLLIGLVSIASGASLGPEAPATVTSVGVASWVGDKTNSVLKLKRAMGMSSLIGMAGGFFILVADSGGFGLSNGQASLSELPFAFIFGSGGALLGVVIGLMMSGLELMFKRYDQKPVQRTLLGALIVAVITYVVPLTMFSGQYVMPGVISNAADAATISLILLATAKLLSTEILLRSGFFGGPTFPALFAGTAAGLAMGQLIPAAASVAVAASLAGLLTVIFKQPLVAGLLAIAVTSVGSIPAVIIGLAGALLIQSLTKYFRIFGVRT